MNPASKDTGELRVHQPVPAPSFLPRQLLAAVLGCPRHGVLPWCCPVTRLELTMHKQPEHIDEWAFKELRREINMTYDMADAWSQ